MQRFSQWLMLLALVAFNVANICLWLHVRSGMPPPAAASRSRIDRAPPPTDAAADVVDNDDSSDGTPPATQQPPPHHRHHHHGKDRAPGKRGGVAQKNVNDPDLMLPSLTAPRHIYLDRAQNRSYAAFFVIGDWGGPGRQPQRDVAHAMDRTAELKLSALRRATENGSDSGVDQQPSPAFTSNDVGDFNGVDFVVSTGDNMYEDGVKDEFDHKFMTHFEQVYALPFLKNLTWFISLGNHDHGAHGVMRDVVGQIRYTKRSRRWFLPSTYYTQLFEVHDEASGGFRIQLVVLDTYDTSPFMTKISAGQLRWFEETLRGSTADWIFVVGHRPIASAGRKHGSSPYLRARLLPAMARYGVTAYMCGDDHELQVLEADGVLLLLSGGGARAKSDLKAPLNETVFQAGVHGFMTVSVAAARVAVTVHDRTGTVLHRVERGKRRPR
jgi:tartrate-resistant acid phosphatase type 5